MLELVSEHSSELSTEQRTNFVQFACITFAQYCINIQEQNQESDFFT